MPEPRHKREEHWARVPCWCGERHAHKTCVCVCAAGDKMRGARTHTSDDHTRYQRATRHQRVSNRILQEKSARGLLISRPGRPTKDEGACAMPQ